MIAITGFLLLLAHTPDTLLASVRALGTAIPGKLPTAVGYLTFADDSAPAANAVDGAPKSRILIANSVFQIRFPRGSIMVDAGMSQASRRKGSPFDQDHYAKILAALEQANLIVITHEHIDHIETVVKGPIAEKVAPHTLLNREQIETLLTKPKVAFTSLDSSRVKDYLVVDYERALPIAPGVVLIRAAGHTPGTQMIYVKLASGREMILASDIAWLSLGVETQRQKPDSTSRFMSEDRAAIGQQLSWLKDAEANGVSVVISHDGTQLQTLAKQGVLTAGID
jgi:glyoxylase-like metal-dependent hydrolase (beta-lactamase superfamily II)